MKRNLKALKRLREVFADAPAERVHMREVTYVAACGTAHCLLGWAGTDLELRKSGLLPTFNRTNCDYNTRALAAARKVFGLDKLTADHLFAFGMTGEMNDVLRENPHAISKRRVMAQLDRVIAGKPIKPYVVKSA